MAIFNDDIFFCLQKFIGRSQKNHKMIYFVIEKVTSVQMPCYIDDKWKCFLNISLKKSYRLI